MKVKASPEKGPVAYTALSIQPSGNLYVIVEIELDASDNILSVKRSEPGAWFYIAYQQKRRAAQLWTAFPKVSS